MKLQRLKTLTDGNKMTKHIHVILPKKLVEQTKRRAKRERRTMTEVIRQALTEYIVDRKEEN